MYAVTSFWTFSWEGTPWFPGRCIFDIDEQDWPVKPFKERKQLEEYSEDNDTMENEPWKLCPTTGSIRLVIRTWFIENDYGTYF